MVMEDPSDFIDLGPDEKLPSELSSQSPADDLSSHALILGKGMISHTSAYFCQLLASCFSFVLINSHVILKIKTKSHQRSSLILLEQKRSETGAFFNFPLFRI